MRISASLIVKNEESCLETCLKSIQGVDEIVIVDTGSTDSTIEIAKRYTDKVYSGEEYLWRDDFAYSRNQSLSKCKGDWVLIIDADEVLEEGGLAKIRKKINLTKKKCIFFDTICASDHKEIHDSIRLFRNRVGITWKGRIHNYLSEIEADKSNIRIYYGCSAAHQQDPDRALRILTKVLEENPNCKREHFYLAREYWYRDDFETAASMYEAYLKKADWAPEMADAQLKLARCYWHLQRGEDARAHCLQAIKINTNFEEAFLLMAEMSGPVNSKRWKEFASTANNEHVLFIRTAKTIEAEEAEEEIEPPDLTLEQSAGVYRPHSDLAKGTFSAGAGCVFSEGVHIDCTGIVHIGKHCLFLRGVQVHTHKHDFFYGNVPDVTKEHGIQPTVLCIGDNVVIAEDATILAGVSLIGDNAVVGTKSVLTHDVGPNEIWAGNPARLIGKRE
jgi:acetyltransferase-like isoleucine patch superfamily enzyme/glycosyltransferase involved in cell wall biosynthesis